MSELRLDDVSRVFTPGVSALSDVSLEVKAGEYLTLVGPSGCGKTTLLRIIAGLEEPTSGEVFLHDLSTRTIPAHQRDVALLLQKPAFHIQKTVRQNMRMAWSLREPLASVRRIFGAERGREDELVRIATMLGLVKNLDRPLAQLSGGEQQRVAVGRCLLRKERILLLDEPLGHLDAPLRTELRREIRELAREFKQTVIHVTHDPVEALAVGDRVAVMREGRILQVDSPRQLRRSPTHRFVADLVHNEDGGFNWLAGEIVKDGVDAYFSGILGRWPVSILTIDHLRESLFQGENFHANSGKVDIMIGIPAAHVRCMTGGAFSNGSIRVALTVQEMESFATGSWVIGVQRQASTSVANKPTTWIGQADEGERFERGQEVFMSFDIEQAYWFDCANDRTLFAPTW